MDKAPPLSRSALITGVAGFIGSHFAESLLQQGWNVLGIDNFDPFYPKPIKNKNLEAVMNTARGLNRKFRFYEGDILTDLDQIEETPSVVIHLAAKAGVRPSLAQPEAYFNTNVMGTLHLLEWCRKREIKKFFFASSSSVYGNSTPAPFHENSLCDQPVSPYAASKRSGELICYNYAQLYQMSIGAARFFTVYGPRQRPDLAINKFAQLLLKGEKIPFYGDGTTERDYTEIRDIIDGSCRLLKWIEETPRGQGRYEVFNIGGCRTTSLNKLLGILESNLKVKASLNRFPEQPGEVRLTYASIDKSRNVLGYDPKVDIENGVQRYCNWLTNSANT